MNALTKRWGLWLLLGLAWMQPAQAQTVVRYYHTDALGSVVAVTDAAGSVVERREYEPYGAQLTPAVQDGPGYTGHVQDAATGLVYMQQRYYDPVIGRFLSVDPVTAYENPIGAFNRYWYASNNPYKFTDPDGRCSELVNEIVGGLPCHLQQRNLDPAHVAADAATARDAKMLVGTQLEIATWIGPFGAGKAFFATATAAETRAVKISCLFVLSGCGSNPVLSEIKSPGKAAREIAGEIADHLKAKAKTLGRATERLRRESPGVRPNKWSSGNQTQNHGFQGVFRVEGRIDSKKLDRILDEK